MTKLEKKVMGIGPGGLGCVCCAPKPGSHARRKIVRIARREIKDFLVKEGLSEYLDDLINEIDKLSK